MITTVVPLTVECENGHMTKLNMISPVVAPDGSVEGLAGSQADFCDVCDSSEMEHVRAELAEVELDPEDVYLYKVSMPA